MSQLLAFIEEESMYSVLLSRLATSFLKANSFRTCEDEGDIFFSCAIVMAHGSDIDESQGGKLKICVSQLLTPHS